MKNESVIMAFINSDEQKKTKHLFIEKNVLFSYGYHYPISLKLDEVFFINSDKYSVTTSRHTNTLKRSVNKKVIDKNTEQLKEIVRLNIKTYAEFVARGI